MPNYRIHRFRVPIDDRPTVRIPEGYHLLSVGPSRDGRDALDLWAIVDPAADECDVPMRVVGTGHRLGRSDNESFRFLGTVPHMDGMLIFHVFEVIPHADSGAQPPRGMPQVTA